MKKIKIIRKQKNMNIKTKFEGVCYHCSKKGHMCKDGKVQKMAMIKKLKKQKKPLIEITMISCYVHWQFWTKKKAKRKKFGL